jgi:2-C-methyl-D-erythritol 2,4-cyclodiphosphate synthase
MINTRIGSAYDVHRLEKGDGIILGGVNIECDKKTIAHSDGDVLYHALGEAILGSLALGDLGTFFPPEDDKFLNMNSVKIIDLCNEKLKEANFEICNVDVSIILEKPKLKPYILIIRNSIKDALHVKLEQVSVKAGTNEGLDAIGRGEAIGCFATVLIQKRQNYNL